MGRSVAFCVFLSNLWLLTLLLNVLSLKAYYNAGSAALVLVLIALAIGGFLWWRHRKNRLSGPPRLSQDGLEESIPLTQSEGGHYADADRYDVKERTMSRKGKERATSLTPTPSKDVIFKVTDDSDDEDGHSGREPRP